MLQRGVRYKQRRWRDRAATVKHGNVKVTRGFIGLKVKPDAMAAFPWAAIPERDIGCAPASQARAYFSLYVPVWRLQFENVPALITGNGPNG